MDKRIECVEFAPDVFAHLRALDKIEKVELQKSMDPFASGNE